jgi:hypothetical protein
MPPYSEVQVSLSESESGHKIPHGWQVLSFSTQAISSLHLRCTFFFSEVIEKYQLDISDVNDKISLLQSDECTDPNKNDKLEDLRSRKTELINLMGVALEAQKVALEAQKSEDQRQMRESEDQRQRQMRELREGIEEYEVEITKTKAALTEGGDEGTRKRLKIKLEELEIRERSRKSMLQALHAPASSEGGQR